jgi:RNA polymerase sigma-70 factor (ECF subfamily)
MDTDISPSEIPWLQPYPDRLLDEAAPDAQLVAKETIELTFLIAVQSLPPNQRAVLVLRDILDWSAAETAAALDTSVASVNSALQRAKATLRRRYSGGVLDPAPPTQDEKSLLDRYMAAHARADAEAVVELLGEGVRFTMPPQPSLFEGREAVAAFFRDAFSPAGAGEFRLVPTRANRQPAAANYLRAPGDTLFRALALDVLRIENGKLLEITTFEPHLFAAFGLPEILGDPPPDR